MPLAVFPKCFLDRLCVTRDMQVTEWIDLASELDVDGLEFYWGFTPDEHPEELSRLREYAADRGLQIPMMCFSPDFTKADARARAAEVERQKEAVDAADALGAAYCRVLTGQRRPGIEFERALGWVVDCIRESVRYAAGRGITLVLENHYKDAYWNYPEFAQRAQTFLAVLDRLGDEPCLGVNYDPSNALIAGEDPIELLDAVKHRVVTMHASDRYLEGGTMEDLRGMEAKPQSGYAGLLKHGVIGEGLNDYDRIFRTLADAGFDGWISIEDGDDPSRGMDHLHRSAAFLRSKMQEHGLS
jgi:sugar phosphate isomerase/epimerase